MKSVRYDDDDNDDDDDSDNVMYMSYAVLRLNAEQNVKRLSRAPTFSSTTTWRSQSVPHPVEQSPHADQRSFAAGSPCGS